MITNDPPTKLSQPQPKFSSPLFPHAHAPPSPQYLPKWMGLTAGWKIRDDLDGPGVWSIRKTGPGCSESSPCPVNNVDLFQPTKPRKAGRGGRNTERKAKKKKKKTCICTLPRVPLSWSRLPSINQPTRHPLSLLCPCRHPPNLSL